MGIHTQLQPCNSINSNANNNENITLTSEPSKDYETTLEPSFTSTLDPTVIETDSSGPSVFPSIAVIPATTMQPFVDPTIYPSSAPSNGPTEIHTALPSISFPPTLIPTSLPSTLQPTNLPTPTGSDGITWWYNTKATVWMWGLDDDTYDSSEFMSAVDYTVRSILGDKSDEKESQNLFKLKTSMVEHAYFNISQHRSNPAFSIYNVDTVDDILSKANPLKIMIGTWSTDKSVSEKLFLRLQRAEEDPVWIIAPMQLKNVKLQLAILTDAYLGTTLQPPEYQYDESPLNIVYIIAGTIVIFFIGVSFLSIVFTRGGLWYRKSALCVQHSKFLWDKCRGSGEGLGATRFTALPHDDEEVKQEPGNETGEVGIEVEMCEGKHILR